MSLDNLKDIEKVFAIIPIFNDTIKQTEDRKASEIKSLIESCNAKYTGLIIVKIREINPATIIGSGKLQEIKYLIEENDTTTVVYDGELTPSQTLNIANILGVKVIDRTTLILDIFAQRATTPEGKIQVELAQLKYIYPRLKGKGSGLSQQGGGIGTRGPGETKLETDRRYIRYRLKFLEKSLEDIKSRRALQHCRRKKNNVNTVALVGYTNVGKSSLLNSLTDSNVLSEDKLFATLDPTYKKLQLTSTEVVVIDTVGFIEYIPHNLIEAFQSTLESATQADLILTIVDINNNPDEQLSVTTKTLNQLNCTTPSFTVYNKCDIQPNIPYQDRNAFYISAKTGFGLDKLKKAINDFFDNKYKTIELKIPFTKLGVFNNLRNYITVIKEDYNDEGLTVSAKIHLSHLNKFEQFYINK